MRSLFYLQLIDIIFQRFSNFVKSGGEAYIIGTSHTDVKIPREERVSIKVNSKNMLGPVLTNFMPLISHKHCALPIKLNI